MDSLIRNAIQIRDCFIILVKVLKLWYSSRKKGGPNHVQSILIRYMFFQNDQTNRVITITLSILKGERDCPQIFISNQGHSFVLLFNKLPSKPYFVTS